MRRIGRNGKWNGYAARTAHFGLRKYPERFIYQNFRNEVGFGYVFFVYKFINRIAFNFPGYICVELAVCSRRRNAADGQLAGSWVGLVTFYNKIINAPRRNTDLGFFKPLNVLAGKNNGIGT